MGLASRVLTYWLRIALYCAQIQLLVKHKNVVCVRVFFSISSNGFVSKIEHWAGYD